MRLPFVLRKTYETELNKSINIITEKNRIIAIVESAKEKLKGFG